MTRNAPARLSLVLLLSIAAAEAATVGCAPGDEAATPDGGSGSGGRGSGGSVSGTGGASTSTGGSSQSGSGGASASGGADARGGSNGTGGASSTGGGANAGGGNGTSSGGTVGSGGTANGTGGAGTGGSAVGSGGAGATGDITLWLSGDSTMANGSTPCPIGWGAKFQTYFNNHVKVTNKAIGGRSVQNWLYDVGSTLSNGECVLNSKNYLPAWTEMLNGMKAGDYLFIQFGINDTDSACPKHVGTELFKTYFGMMAQAAKERGANPIFLTPVSSIACSGSTATPTRGRFATATKEAGTQYNVPVIDLEQLSVKLYTSLGFCPLPGPDSANTYHSGEIGKFFCEDHTHFESDGAAQIASLVAKAVKDQGLGLASYLTK